MFTQSHTGIEGSLSAGFAMSYRIEFKNNEKIFLTSLIIKPNSLPIAIQHTMDRKFTIIKDFSYDTLLKSELKDTKLQADNDVQKFKELYKGYNQTELLEIINNDKKFQHSAVIAARELMDDKNKIE